MTLKDTPDIVTAAGVAGPRVHRRGADRQRAGAGAQAQGRQGDRRAASTRAACPGSRRWTNPRGRRPYDVNPTYDYTCGKGGDARPGRLPDPRRSRRTSTPRSTWWSPATRTSPTSATSRTPTGNDRLLTSASSFGRLFTETDLTYDRRKRDIVRSSVEGANMPVTRDVTKDAEQTSLIAHYTSSSKPIASKVIGQITTDVTKDPPPEAPTARAQLGDLIADAQLADDSVGHRRQDAGDRVHEPRRHPRPTSPSRRRQVPGRGRRATSPTRRRSRSSRSTTTWCRWT